MAGTKREVPKELIVVDGENIEENVNHIVADVFEPLGFVVKVV